MNRSTSVFAFASVLCSALAACALPAEVEPVGTEEPQNTSDPLASPSPTVTPAGPCNHTTTTYGTMDNFVGAELPPLMNGWMDAYLTSIGTPASVRVGYDYAGGDKHFVTYFRDVQTAGHPFCYYHLRLRVKPVLGGSYNDALFVGSVIPGTISSTVAASGSLAALTGTTWNVGVSPQFVDVDLLAAAQAIPLNDGRLFMVRIQDDTAVDYIQVERGMY